VGGHVGLVLTVVEQAMSAQFVVVGAAECQVRNEGVVELRKNACPCERHPLDCPVQTHLDQLPELEPIELIGPAPTHRSTE